MTTPSTQQAIEAARILGQYFDNPNLDHSQKDEENTLHSFAQAHSDSMASLSHSNEDTSQLAALAYLQEQIGYVVWDIVDRERKSGQSWANIGDALGVSRQAAQQRYGTKAD